MRHPFVWCDGRILPECELRISAADRTFEHGLGLFETLRTWGGRPTLLPEHLGRLRESAAELRLPLDPSTMPDAPAIASLLEANAVQGDAMLRITMTGGISIREPATLWVRSGPLPEAKPEGLTLVLWETVAIDDELARHKTLNYWARRRVLERAALAGADDAFLHSEDQRVLETARSNVFIVRDGIVKTPGLEAPILPGIMRGVVLLRAKALGIEAVVGDVMDCELLAADEVFLTNSLRGVQPVCGRPSAGLRDLIPAGDRRPGEIPGPITRRLRDDVERWLMAGKGGMA